MYKLQVDMEECGVCEDCIDVCMEEAISRKAYTIIIDTNKCDNCGECEMCDLNPEKICDNCGKCIETDGDYGSLQIDDILLSTEGENI